MGIYRSFDDAPPSNQQDAQYLVESARLNFRAQKSDEATGLPVLRNSHSLFPLSVALLSRLKPFRILDVGGAAGVDFANLLKATSCRSDVEYSIVDLPEVCELGRQSWEDDRRVAFGCSLPDDHKVFDLVYSSWAIQYFPEPLTLLEKLTTYQAKAILILNVPFTTKRAFVRMQTNKMIPSWVLSLPEVERTMRDRGYKMVFHVAGDVDHNVDNYPFEYRVSNLSNLLFLKSSD
jgi:putative methyltransferase (TIGR04325 family)